MSNNENIKKYEILLSVWKQWDISYWTSFHIYIVIMGLFFAGFTQVFEKDIFAAIFCIVGVIISIIWLFNLNRKFAHLTCAEHECRKLENEIYKNNKKKGEHMYGVHTSTKKFAIRDPSNEEYDKEYLGEINTILKFKKHFAIFPTSTIIAVYFPIIIIFFWIILGMTVSLLFFLIFGIFILGFVYCLYYIFRGRKWKEIKGKNEKK